MKKIIQKKALLQLDQEPDDSDDSDSETDSDEETVKQHHDPQSFIVYPSLAILSRDWAVGKSLSVVMVDAEVYGCYRSSSSKLLMALQVVPGSAEKHFGLWYHGLGINEDSMEDNAAVDEVHVTCYGLLLPLARSWPPSPPFKYTLVTSHWLVWDKNGELAKPYTLTTA